MGALRTHVAAGLILISQALPLRADALPLFAACTGRFSALIEHQWLMGEPSEPAMAEREAMLGLLDAAGGGQQAMALRIEAKAAEAALLRAATFGPESRRPWAAARAKALIADCRRLLSGA